MRNVTKCMAIGLTAALVLVSVAACTAGSPGDKSAAMVLDNAGSVVRTGADKLWIEPQATPAAANTGAAKPTN